MTTQAELWARFLKMRTDNAPALTQHAVARIVADLHTDYPHQVLILTDNGNVIGTRRVFLADRSFADMLIADPEHKVHVGTLTGGRVGIAHNGTAIEKLN